MKGSFQTIILCGLLLSCTQGDGGAVEHYGTLRAIMMDHDYSAKVNLKDFEQKENLYAVGALEGIQGEIIILNSKPYIAHFDKALMIIDSLYDFEAAMLVTSQTEAWNTSDVPQEPMDQSAFEEFLLQVGAANGFTRDDVFPFILEGRIDSLSWHIVNGTMPQPGQSHRESGVKGSLKDDQVTMLGFYSNHDQGIFTHNSTHFHIHYISADKRIVGHVDDFVTGKTMKLKIPKR